MPSLRAGAATSRDKASVSRMTAFCINGSNTCIPSYLRAIKMIDSMVGPLIDEVLLAVLALETTEKLQYVTHSEGPMTPALNQVSRLGRAALCFSLRICLGFLKELIKVSLRVCLRTSI